MNLGGEAAARTTESVISRLLLKPGWQLAQLVAMMTRRCRTSAARNAIKMLLGFESCRRILGLTR
jgi:hypothetical protein